MAAERSAHGWPCIGGRRNLIESPQAARRGSDGVRYTPYAKLAGALSLRVRLQSGLEQLSLRHRPVSRRLPWGSQWRAHRSGVASILGARGQGEGEGFALVWGWLR